MAKWFGKIGFEGQTVETAPSVFTEEMVEREYYGDVLEWGRQLQAGDGVNDNVTFQNRLSIVADPFAHENFGSIDLGGSGSSGGFLSNIWQWLKGGASAAKSFLGGASKAAAGASGAAKIIPVLNSVGTATANGASGVTTVAKAAGVAKAAATTAGAATSGVLAKAGMGIAKVAASLGPHGLLAAAVIAGTVAVGTAVVKNWDKVKEAVGNAWSWIKEKASGLWDGMKSIGGNLMSGLATGVKSAAKFGLKVALSPAYESSYVQLKAGSTELKEGTGIRTWFGGTMSFYAGDGAVLTPEKTVNIGTMDATLNRSGRTVVVQADEAVMVSVEYRPAFL